MKKVSHLFKNFETLSDFMNENGLNNANNVLLQVFSGYIDSFFLDELVKFVEGINNNITIMGTTTDGEIYYNRIFENRIVLSFVIFEETTLKSVSVSYRDVENYSFDAGKYIAENVIEDNTKVVIMFADGLATNGEELLAGFESINNSVIVAGGLSGDNSSFINCYVFDNKKILKNGVVAVSLNSDKLEVINDYIFDWKPIGKKMKVTKSNKNIVYEIDGKPVIDIFKKYLGDNIVNYLPQVGIQVPFVLERDGILIGRAVTAKNSDGSLSFAGNLYEGEEINFCIARNSDLLLNSKEKIGSLKNKNEIGELFIYSCMARRKSLDNYSQLELNLFNHLNYADGFFTYGEFFSKKSDNGYKYELFNETLTLLSLKESGDKFDIKRDESLEFDLDTELSVNNCVIVKESLISLINVTSQELEELNKKLEQEVKEKVEENMKQQKIIFQQSKQAQMGEMLSMIAHQWRQPLNAISANIINLSIEDELGGVSSELIQSSSQFIQNQVQKMSKIIDSFIEFVKPEGHKKEFLFSDVIEDSLEMMSAQFKNRSIEVEWTKEIEGIKLFGYRTLLEQVIINLCSNSRDAFENLSDNINKKMIFRCYLKDGDLYLSVKDNAGGIPEDVQDRIFNPYFTTKGVKGTGLGLYMSRDILRKEFCGDLTFEVKDDTTTFYIKIGKGCLLG